MTGATVIRPLPGLDVLQAQTMLLTELTEVPDGVQGVPALVSLPARGWAAEAVGRSCALLTGMPVELGPHGWRLTDRPGREADRLRSQLREDLDALAVAAHGYTGRLALPVLGPWALASVLYLTRNERVLSDSGAVRELIAALGDGVADLLTAVRVAVPGAEPVVVLREPALTDLLRGSVPDFSGRGHLRAVPGHDVGLGLAGLVEIARANGATVVADGGEQSSPGPLQVLAASGADGLGVQAEALGSPGWEQVAGLVEAGRRIWFGVTGAGDGPRPDVRLGAESIAGPWTAVGLPPAGLDDVVVHIRDSSTQGTRPGDDAWTPAVQDDVRRTVQIALRLAERAAGG